MIAVLLSSLAVAFFGLAADPPGKHIAATSHKQSRNADLKALQDFLNQYHRAPVSDAVEKQLAVLLDDKLTDDPYFNETDEQSLKITGHAFGLIAQGKPSLVRLYESKYQKANHNGRLLILEALCVAGDKHTLERLTEWRNDPTQADMARAIDETRKYVPVHTLPRDKSARNPLDLDLLWTDFLITGQYAPVCRIMDVLDRPDKLREKIDTLIAQNPAKRTTILDALAEVKLARPGQPPKLVQGDLEFELAVIGQNLPTGAGKTVIQKLNDTLGLTQDSWTGIQMKGVVNSISLPNLRQYPRLTEVLKAHLSERPPKSRAIITTWLANR